MNSDKIIKKSQSIENKIFHIASTKRIYADFSYFTK